LNKNLEVREKTMARLLADGKTYQLKHEKEKMIKINKFWVGNHFGFTDIW
jgi:hypothetical protein